MKKQVCIWLLILTAMVCLITVLTEQIRQVAKITHLLVAEDTRELLRQQKVPPEQYEAFCKFEKDTDYTRYDYLLGYLFTEKKNISYWLQSLSVNKLNHKLA